MPPVDTYDSPAAFVAENRELLVRVLRHSSDPYARACAWALLDAGGDPPDLEQVRRELARVEEAS